MKKGGRTQSQKSDRVKKWEPSVCWEAETHAHIPSLHKFANESAKDAIKTTHH